MKHISFFRYKVFSHSPFYIININTLSFFLSTLLKRLLDRPQHILGETVVSLPRVYHQGSLVQVDFEPILRVCLLDPSFPAFVEEMEGELEKLLEEWRISTYAGSRKVNTAPCGFGLVCVGSVLWRLNVSCCAADAVDIFYMACYCMWPEGDALKWRRWKEELTIQ